MQESPDAVPKGELPRHMQIYVDRYLTDKIVPGNRVTVIGIYSIRQGGVNKRSKVSRHLALALQMNLVVVKGNVNV